MVYKNLTHRKFNCNRNFISCKDTNKVRAKHSKSDNFEVMAYGNPDEIIEELFDSPLFRYQFVLQTQMRGSNFIFDCVNLRYYIPFTLTFN